VILPDVNVLLYTYRPDAVSHREYKKWLADVVNGAAAYGMSPQVLASVIRIATHPRVYVQPDKFVDVSGYADFLLNQPHCQIVQPGPRHWEIFCDLCRHGRAIGNLVQDAWFAALAIESGCEWITADRDFSRFPGLRWRAPF
jgi:uncharacterized protein